MNDGALLILWALLRTGLVLTVAAVALSAFLRLYPVASPTVRRTAYFVILLQGCLLVRSPVAIPLPDFIAKATQTLGWNKLASRAPARDSDAGRQWREPRVHSYDPASVFGSMESDHGARGATSAAFGEPSPLARAGGEWASSPNGRLPPDFAETVSLGDSNVIVPPTNQLLLGLVVLWAVGMVVLSGRAAWTYFRFVRRLPPLEDVEPEWADEWDALQRDAGIRSPAALAVAEQAGPVLCRLPGGYRLIVPAADWRVLTPSQRLLVLRHELAHLERRDVWKSLAMRVLALPHWFNPLVWRIVRQFDECAELACDERVGRAAPEHVPDYARALLQLAHRAEPVFFATRAARQCGLSQRIRRLLIPVTEKGSKMKTAVMVTLLLGISLVNFTRLQTRAGDQPKQTFSVIVSAPQASALAPQEFLYSNAKIEFVGSVANVAQTESRQAKVDLGRILKNLHEYQREREKLQAEQQVWQATRAKEREGLVRTAKERIAAEKDPLIKDLLEKGIAEKRAEMSREVNPKAAEDEQQVKHRLYDKIMAEINRYAQERQLLTVRRVDFGNRTTGMVGVTGLGLGPEKLFINTTRPQKLTATASAAPAEQLNLVSVMLNIAPSLPNTWDQEVIYVAGRDSAQEVDISDEIAKRLNAADEKPAGK
jgi:beta-lactamase regulating signal transducer with metallopeptidase domain